MFDLFVNPWAMAAGTLLVSSPIIIHLINRMRFKRIHWAAMEFLLKSQKKNQRRIIIEQIILLLLRILLVLLAGFLLARFLGALAGPQQNTLHVVLLDDTPSQGDVHAEQGRRLEAFQQGKRLIVEEIADYSSQATTPQTLVLLKLSDLATPRRIERLNASTVEELRNYLSDAEVSNIHVDLSKGLEEAQKIFEQNPQERRLLHVVSDFRARDWTGSPSDGIRKSVDQLRAMKVDVHLLDDAYPIRGDSKGTVLYHDNLAIIDLVPETRVIGRYVPVEFQVGVANFSNSERKNVRVTVRVKGQERAEGSFTMPSVQPGTVTNGNFMITFDQLGPNPVSVNLENEEAGLAIDNTRHAVVEVREKVPLLMIEGDPKTKGTSESDAYYLNSLFSESTRGFDVILKTPLDLEKIDLDNYPSIFLLNVPRLTEKAQQQVEKYVRNGGGIAFFMGPEVKPEFYNKWYADGKGLFPVVLADKPTEPSGDPGERLMKMFSNPLPKLYPRNDSHPIFTRIYRDERTHNQSRENNKYLVFASIDRYFPVPRSKWTFPPGTIDELMTLPNSRKVADFADEANRIINQIQQLPLADANNPNAKFKAALDGHVKSIRDALLAGGDLYKLALPLDRLLNDSGVANDPTKPNLQEFWQQGEQGELRERLSQLLEAVRYGDPYLVGRTFGKGRVLAYLSTANAAWNDLPNGPSRVYYVMLMVEMQKYLASNVSDVSLLLGSPLELNLDSARYEAKARRFFPPKGEPQPGKQAASIDAGEQAGRVEGNRVIFQFSEAKVPGVYQFILNRKDAPAEDGDKKPDAPPKAADKGDAEKQRQDTLAFAYNIDAVAESDLRRASQDDISSVAPQAHFHKPGDGSYEGLLKQKKSDLSELSWLFLVFLIVLLVEQAMAVRLSFHAHAPGEAPK
ncbi:MAG TPA: BatA domain-containing protein [Gemmataceae bacterium]|jgi:hypothetical protein|nr:BatA domain-containing protein [Gemmataceae bacterium]